MKTFVIRDATILERAIAFARANWQAMAGTNHPLMIEFKPEKKKRSSKALRYYWNILRQVEEFGWVEGKQYSADPVWDDFFKRRFIGSVDGPCGLSVALHSSELDADEFAAYVQQVECWAASELGITFIDNTQP